MDKTQDSMPAAVRTPDQARSAVKLNAMRYVLAISLTGAVVAMIITWLVFGG